VQGQCSTKKRPDQNKDYEYGTKKHIKTQLNRIHPSVTIFGKTYRCIALQETNEL